MDGRNYDQAENCAVPMSGLTKSVGDYIPPTDRQKLEQKKAALAFELQRVEEALQALDAHPELENFTKVMQRALR